MKQPKKMPVVIRPMQRRDIAPLARIYVDVYDAAPVAEHWAIKTAKNMLTYWFEKQKDLAFVAEKNGKLVGAFVAGIKPWWDGNHLFDGEIFVHPQFQKQGIGKELSKALYAKALKKYNVTIFDAFTFKKTAFPLQWYKAQGFTEQEEWVMISGDVKMALVRVNK